MNITFATFEYVFFFFLFFVVIIVHLSDDILKDLLTYLHGYTLESTLAYLTPHDFSLSSIYSDFMTL